MSGANILRKTSDEIKGEAGIALLKIKNAHGLSLEALSETLGVHRDMIAHYIAGEHEMGFTKWLRAIEAFPELAELLGIVATPTPAERLERIERETAALRKELS